MATENGWRARRIQGELSKLGIDVSLATISRYLPKIKSDPGAQQRWTTFLRITRRDRRDGLLVVPTLGFRLLYVWFALDHGRRRVLSFDVTASPTARWVSQQLSNTFSSTPKSSVPDPRQRRDLLRQRSTEVIEGLGLHPQRTALQSPWQNGTAERFVGTVRRELLDHWCAGGGAA